MNSAEPGAPGERMQADPGRRKYRRIRPCLSLNSWMYYRRILEDIVPLIV
jgi:hypothetical protein